MGGFPPLGGWFAPLPDLALFFSFSLLSFILHSLASTLRLSEPSGIVWTWIDISYRKEEGLNHGSSIGTCKEMQVSKYLAGHLVRSTDGRSLYVDAN